MQQCIFHSQCNVIPSIYNINKSTRVYDLCLQHTVNLLSCLRWGYSLRSERLVPSNRQSINEQSNQIKIAIFRQLAQISLSLCIRFNQSRNFNRAIIMCVAYAQTCTKLDLTMILMFYAFSMTLTVQQFNQIIAW